MRKKMIEENRVRPGDAAIPVEPAVDQYNRYNITLPQSFSVYNDEGNIIYRGDVEKVANQLRAEIFGVGAAEPVQVKQEVVTGKRYDKKRAFFLVLTLILSCLMIAVAVLGIFNIDVITDYISIYNYKGMEIMLLDPVMSFVKNTFGDLGLPGPTVFEQFKQTGEGFLGACVYYMLPISIVLYLLFALIMFFASIAGLARKRDAQGFYKKTKLGFLSIVMFLCSLLVAECGANLVLGSAMKVVDFISGSGDFIAGYVMYVLIAVPVITFICTCCAFRRYRVRK